jgi:hypothetical protein
MDIPVIAIAIIAALLLPRQRALLVAPIAWAVVVLVICCALVIGISAFRARRTPGLGS